jgi:hypothetical protein
MLLPLVLLPLLLLPFTLPPGLTSELLVLVEPGTPAGHANVLEARDAVLMHEARRAAKLQRRLAATTAVDSSSNATASSSMLTEQHQQQQQQGDANLASKLGSKWFGAHVVAPCPHDGTCPLSGPGAKAWCHFGTRFQRPAFMQVCGCKAFDFLICEGNQLTATLGHSHDAQHSCRCVREERQQAQGMHLHWLCTHALSWVTCDCCGLLLIDIALLLLLLLFLSGCQGAARHARQPS